MNRLCLAIIIVALVGSLTVNVEGWGGLFNRFSPEMLSNLGYGHSDVLNRPGAMERPAGSYADNRLEEEYVAPCEERKCAWNGDCCPGQVCFINGDDGKCVFMMGLKQGEICRRDNDCETGLMCSEVPGSEFRSCQPPITTNKLYNEECTISAECDIGRGLCCQLQRRHRQTLRKVCSYFKDPLVCIGPVATDQINSIIQYTSGEKRIAAQPMNRIYKRAPFA